MKTIWAIFAAACAMSGALGAPARATTNDDVAPLAAARAANEVCVAAMRDGGDIAGAARLAGLRASPKPDMALPGYIEGAPLWRVPSTDGQVFVYLKSGAATDCRVAIAYSPPEGADLAADALAKTGMRKGGFGSVGESGRYQQLTSADGRIWVNAVAYERPAGKPAPAITVALQVGAN
jgi:hypothetical protein